MVCDSEAISPDAPGVLTKRFKQALLPGETAELESRFDVTVQAMAREHEQAARAQGTMDFPEYQQAVVMTHIVDCVKQKKDDFEAFVVKAQFARIAEQQACLGILRLAWFQHPLGIINADVMRSLGFEVRGCPAQTHADIQDRVVLEPPRKITNEVLFSGQKIAPHRIPFNHTGRLIIVADELRHE